MESLGRKGAAGRRHVCPDPDGQGEAGDARIARQGPAWPGEAVVARHGTARMGTARCGPAGQAVLGTGSAAR